MKKPSSFLYQNGLSIAMIGFMLIFWAAQFYTGWIANNEDLIEKGQAIIGAGEYAVSGHFLQATFENWESEFLQMAIYVIFTVFLRQKGSAESRKLQGEKGAAEEEDEHLPKVHAHAPWPVKKDGIWLWIYGNSLSLILIGLFLFSFVFHFIGSLQSTNDELLHMGREAVGAKEYISDAKFWFESFQNWQSEFLAVAAIVLLTIWFRQKGSPESKPVSAPNDQTGK